MNRLAIVVPLYRRSDLVEPLFNSLISTQDELRALNARVILVNDSPDDPDLRKTLECKRAALAGAVDVEFLENPVNLGFVASANRGLEIALAEGRDALLLNSDALLTPGALAEMVAVADLDPMIGFVSPRSNNATICNSPYPDRFRGLDPAAAVRAHETIRPRLPRYTYAPTAVGFCLLIRHTMLSEFGLLDPAYGHGFNEDDDFIFRCNRRGYRAMLANYAFVYHQGGASFAVSEVTASVQALRNDALLRSRYPEYDRAIDRYFSSAEFWAQNLAAGFVGDAAGRLSLLFECGHLGPYHTGTSELGVSIVRAFTALFADRYDVHVICPPAVAAYHGLGAIPGVTLHASPDAASDRVPFAAAIRLAQPFAMSDLMSLSSLAPVTGFMMLDTIALDCQNLDENGLAVIWDRVAHTSSLVAYISAFSRSQFRARFQPPARLIEAVTPLPTRAEDYASEIASAAAKTPAAGYVLMVGNNFAHKAMAEALDEIGRQGIERRIVVLGRGGGEGRANVTGYESGQLEPAFVEALFDGASMVLFPSHYEGFGFPVMHALARRKPVVGRRIPASAEMLEQTPHAANMHLFDQLSAMVAALKDDIAWVDETRTPTNGPYGWDDTAGALEGAITEAIARHDHRELVERLQILAPFEELRRYRAQIGLELEANGRDTRHRQLKVALKQYSAYRQFRSVWESLRPRNRKFPFIGPRK